MNRKILIGDRIKLRLLEEKDLEKRVSFLNDEQVQMTLNYDVPTSVSKTKAWFNRIVLDTSRVEFAITLSDDKVIGFGGLINIDQSVRKAELHIFIGDRQYWGGGFGRDGYKLITNYAFQQLGLNRVYGYQLDFNEKAQKAIKAIGWSIEGCLREDIRSHGVTKNRYVVSILRDEWESCAEYDSV